MASENGHLEAMKYLIDEGSEVNCTWSNDMLKHKMLVFTLISNFNDPFFQRFNNQTILTPTISILIENGMI